MPAPEPYYDDGKVRLYLGRCEDVLPHLAGVQLTVTSPPYNTGNGSASRQGRRASGRGDVKHGRPRPIDENPRAMDELYPDDLPEPGYQAQQVAVAKLVAAASTPDAAFFYNHKPRYRAKAVLHPVELVRQFDGWALHQEVVWCRPGGITHQGGMFVAADERIYWLVRDLANFQCAKRAGQWLTWWQMNPPTVRNGHPVPFPATIPERAMLTATSRGDLVLDPYAGSGTTLRVAKALGRRAVGIEAHEPYAEAAAAMLATM